MLPTIFCLSETFTFTSLTAPNSVFTATYHIMSDPSLSYHTNFSLFMYFYLSLYSYLPYHVKPKSLLPHQFFSLIYVVFFQFSRTACYIFFFNLYLIINQVHEKMFTSSIFCKGRLTIFRYFCHKICPSSKMSQFQIQQNSILIYHNSFRK